MLKSEVKVGETYYATISGRQTKVKITGVSEKRGYGKTASGQTKPTVTNWSAVNLSTNKPVTIKSAQSLKRIGILAHRSSSKTPSLSNPSIEGASGHATEATERVSLASLLSGPTESPVAVLESPSVKGEAIGVASALSFEDVPFETEEKPSRKPTEEQRAILEEAQKYHPRLIIEAGAGTGKTTTLRMLADVLRGNGQYTAFNTSLVHESASKFRGTRVACNTTHSLAFRSEGREFSHRLDGPRIKSTDIADMLGLSDYTIDVGDGKRSLFRGFLAGQVMQAIKRFCQSDDQEIETRHFKYIEGIDLPDEDGNRSSDNNHRVRKHLLPYAEKAWADIRSPRGRLPFSHDYYVKIWQLGNPVIVGDYGLLDEAQDTAPVLLDIIRQQKIPFILVGDSCQPPETLVETPKGKVRIDQIKKGDLVVSYDIQHRHIRKTGSVVKGVSRSEYFGDLIVVNTSAGHKSRYTPEHVCLARFGSGLIDKHMVYMMRKGKNYRIGVAGGEWLPSTKNKKCLGITKRFHQERADALWVLSVHDTRDEALIAEAITSWTYAVPTLLFRSLTPSAQRRLDVIWGQIGDNSFLADKCLEDFGRNINYPLADRSGFLTQLQYRRLFEIRACNLIDGMELPWWNKSEKHGTNHERDWTTAIVSRVEYYGHVYSMDVDKDNTYVGDGIVTHNCQSIYEWRGAVNAMEAFEGAPRLFLSQSFRFGPAVADVANAVLSTLDEPAKLKLKGLPSIDSKVYTKVTDTPPAPDCILTRTNAVAVTAMLEAVSKGRKPHLVGGGSSVVSFVEAAASLQQLAPTGHPELACFSSWQEVQEYSKMDEGEDLRLMVKLIDGFGCDNILKALKGMATEKQADLVICTAHKSKGREWDAVQLSSDFPTASKCSDADRRLLYVAVTRAKLSLDISRCPFFTGQDSIDLSEVIARLRTESGDTKPVEPAKVTAPEKFTWVKKNEKWLVRGPSGFTGKTVEVFRKDNTSQRKYLSGVVETAGPVSLYKS